MIGEHILKLRKMQGLSQEQLGERVNVTRQTISNWELGETTPNIEQLKLLSKELNISIDELLDNNVEGVLMKKIINTEKSVSNTEQLSCIILKMLKVFGKIAVVYIMLVIIAIVCLAIYTFIR